MLGFVPLASAPLAAPTIFLSRLVQTTGTAYIANISTVSSRINYDPRIVPSEPVELDHGDPLTVGLQASWLLNTPNPIDYSGNEYHGKSVNSPAMALSQRGIVTSFSGTGSTPFQAITTPLFLNNQPRLSVSCWVSPRAANFAGTASPNPRFVANSHSDGDHLGFQIYYNASGNLFTFDVGNGSGYGEATSSATPAIGTWWHLVGTYDGSTVRIYVNGVLGTTGTVSGNISNNSYNVTIGYNPATSTDYVPGNVSTVQIFNRALSANEVQQLYLQPYAHFIPLKRRNFDTPIPDPVQGIGAALGTAQGSITGTSTISANTTIIVGSTGTISSSSIVAGVTGDIATSTASSSSSASASGIAATQVITNATASSASFVSGLSNAINSTTGTIAAGTGTDIGVGSAVIALLGSAPGLAVVTGFVNALACAIATGSGTGSVAGQAVEAMLTVATASGSSTVNGVSSSPMTGQISGTSTILGISAVPPPPVVVASQSLYPQVLFDAKAAMQTPNVIPPGNLALIALDMYYVDLMQIIVTQLSPWGEDYALRAWVSEFPNGVSVIALTPANYFPLMRVTPRPLVLYTARQQPPSGDPILAPVYNTRYFLNIQNLTNTPNAFSFLQMNLA